MTKESTGITYRGNNDPTDALTPQIVPYEAGRFPLQAGGSFVQLNRAGLDFGQDVDRDGRNERLNITSQITVVDFSTVTVPAGTFQNVAQIRTDSTLAVILTSNGQTITGKGVATDWYALELAQSRQSVQLK